MGKRAGSLPGGVFWVLPHLESRFLGTRGMTAPERPGLARACQSWHELAQAFQQRELVVAADLLFVQRASISSKGVRLGASFLMQLTVLCTAGKPLPTAKSWLLLQNHCSYSKQASPAGRIKGVRTRSKPCWNWFASLCKQFCVAACVRTCELAQAFHQRVVAAELLFVQVFA